jgi:hypothetical protein
MPKPTFRPNASFEYSADLLREKGFTLLDVLHLFREGTVTSVDKLDGPGGVWVVEGFDTDDRLVSAVILVFYQASIVRLHSIELNEEGPIHDAA